jgi:hypothetical protein
MSEYSLEAWCTLWSINLTGLHWVQCKSGPDMSLWHYNFKTLLVMAQYCKDIQNQLGGGGTLYKFPISFTTATGEEYLPHATCNNEYRMTLYNPLCVCEWNWIRDLEPFLDTRYFVTEISHKRLNLYPTFSYGNINFYYCMSVHLLPQIAFN